MDVQGATDGMRGTELSFRGIGIYALQVGVHQPHSQRCIRQHNLEYLATDLGFG